MPGTKSTSGLQLPQPLNHEGSAAGLCAPGTVAKQQFPYVPVCILAELFCRIGNSEEFPIRQRKEPHVFMGSLIYYLVLKYSFLYFLTGALSCLYVNALRHFHSHLTRRRSLLCSTISFRIGVCNFLLMFALINSVCQWYFLLRDCTQHIV